MFTVLDRISWPGSPEKPNEDSCGACRDWAWVIDTSIFPGTPAIMGEGSDATWLAGFASRRLSDLAPQADDGPALVRHVMEEARTAFLARAPQERHDAFTWPVGAMTLVRRKGGRLDVWSFADTTAFVRRSDGAVLTVGEAPGMRQFEMAKAAELLQASGATPKTIVQTTVFQTWLAERRERQKQGRGPALLGLDPSAADRLRHESVPCDEGTVVLLTSDGFSALVDLYQAMDAKALVETALTDGLEALARRAREIETQVDPEGRLYPRFKESDDTTGLLLRA
ncbi:protein phosphatase 2C domain-containing protein [Microvirga lenta]|uniref:protein phosphatase 2C domain-containing protein n=1 Tax=Microvirga lenta TaxID=2881337 RepID=UPI001D000745|nr:protein phosphatase 2C domain-containing protein [Microvirga lenta]MCB5176961.1 protein phosphatase 2C domain-containing protein [Microvirga lenta]